MAAAGVFALLNAYGLLKYLQARLTGQQFRKLFFASVMASAGLVFVTVVLLTYLGYIAPWSGRFYSLWDTGYKNDLMVLFICLPYFLEISPWARFNFEALFYAVTIRGRCLYLGAYRSCPCTEHYKEIKT